VAYSDIQKVRLTVADIDINFPILSDSDYEYFLEKNSNSISRASLDAARTILLVLSQRSDETIDIFSIRGTKIASEYRQSLQLFLKDPSTNPVLQNCKAWFGGVSNSDIAANIANPDNNLVTVPSQSPFTTPSNPPRYF
jgi:type IV pilus biogenesis protein CpaD/CtpE